MITKKLMEQFIAGLEGDPGVDQSAVDTLRHRVAEIIFNDYGICSGAVSEKILADQPEIDRRFDVFAANYRDEEDIQRLLRYEKEVCQGEGMLTRDIVSRFFDRLEAEGMEPERLIKLRDRLAQAPSTIGYVAGSLEFTKADSSFIDMIGAEAVIGEMELIRRFRKERMELVTAEDRERVRAALSPQLYFVMDGDGDHFEIM